MVTGKKQCKPTSIPADEGSLESSGYNRRASLFMKIAGIFEKDLNDTKSAGIYYRKLVAETPNDVRSFFALEKALLLGAISPEEVADFNLHGVTDEVVQGILNKKK